MLQRGKNSPVRVRSLAMQQRQLTQSLGEDRLLVPRAGASTGRAAGARQPASRLASRVVVDLARGLDRGSSSMSLTANAREFRPNRRATRSPQIVGARCRRRPRATAGSALRRPRGNRPVSTRGGLDLVQVLRGARRLLAIRLVRPVSRKKPSRRTHPRSPVCSSPPFSASPSTRSSRCSA